MDIEVTRCHLYEIIYKRGYTPQQFAEIIGVKKSQLSMYNSMDRMMSMNNALIYSSILNCSVNDFYSYRVKRRVDG
ncbi:helix-turn-helix domain-containing protein [Paenibacillus apiarius]|uniref:helix-turn-helix domain-containing protein n=1 Tax=Paenibacillus apiarius TaxID=46240 RepID=UPI003B3B139A